MEEASAGERRNAAVVLAVGAIVVGGLISLVDGNEDVADWAGWQQLGLALLYLSAGNAAAIGGIRLCDALRTRPFGSTQRRGRRRSFALKLLGANCLLVGLGVTMLDDSLGYGSDYSKLGLATLVVALATGFGANRLLRRGAKHETASAADAMASDPRPPVVYVRSFRDDDGIVVGSRLARLSTAPFAWTAMVSAEQELARSLRRVGPVVAIGKPGESLPQLGAARLYVGDDEWRETIVGLMGRASLVVVRAGPTANLWWEIEQAATRLSPERLILLSIGSKRDRRRFEREVQRRFGPVAAPPSRALDAGRILYFDAARKLHAEPIRLRLEWSPFLFVSPLRATLDAAVRRVLATLGIAGDGAPHPQP